MAISTPMEMLSSNRSSPLRGAADKIGSVDAGELNEAVAALKAAAENLSDIDIASLNSLVEALDGTATKLGSAVNAIGGIFGR